MSAGEARNDLRLVNEKIAKLLEIPEKDFTRRLNNKLQTLSDIADELRKMAEEKPQENKKRKESCRERV